MKNSWVPGYRDPGTWALERDYSASLTSHVSSLLSSILHKGHPNFLLFAYVLESKYVRTKLSPTVSAAMSGVCQTGLVAFNT